MPENNTHVSNPTWYGDIRHFFTETDIAHMKPQGLDLTSYEDVRGKSGAIYGQVAAGRMPPQNPWPQSQVDAFLQWMTDGYPKGVEPLSKSMGLFAVRAFEARRAGRVRREINDLSNDEFQLVVKAFQGILAKDPSDPNSYFAQAGIHWLPMAGFCQHHVPGYNPWHRAYLVGFENALRSVPGCESVTLPYWDITKPFPERLKAAPFDSYTLPKDIGQGYNAGYMTSRFDYVAIQANLENYDVAGDIAKALAKTDWEDFHGLFAGATNDTIIMAHDEGHVSIGTTLQKQEVASFDPAFWFFHANWDRLFWKWQKQMQATGLKGLLSTIDKDKDPQSYRIFTNPVLMSAVMAPFDQAPLTLKTVDVIDSAGNLDVDYDEPNAAAPEAASVMNSKTIRTSLAARPFSVRTDHVNVRVEGVNRLKIPGTFRVHLLRDGKPIATKAFFQPVEVEKCENCVQNAIVHFDFKLPAEAVAKGKLGVRIEPLNTDFVGDTFPLKLAGDPTVDVRFLLTNE